jgi:hypothetical protein
LFEIIKQLSTYWKIHLRMFVFLGAAAVTAAVVATALLAGAAVAVATLTAVVLVAVSAAVVKASLPGALVALFHGFLS